MNNNSVSSWTSLTVRDYIKMKEIAGLQVASEAEKNLMVAALLARIDYKDFELLPLKDVEEYMDNAKFLLEKPVPDKARREYEINGRTYRLFKDPSEMSVAQYIDFAAIEKEGFDKMPAEMLAIFLVPDGHQYNDGYDKEQQIEDMMDMSVTEALGVCDFFTKRLSKSINLILTALRLRMKWMRITARKEDRKMMKALETQMRTYLKEIEDIYGLIV